MKIVKLFSYGVLSACALTLLSGCDKTVNTVASQGGKFEPVSQVVKGENETALFTLLAEPGFVLAGVEGCGGRLEGDRYTTSPVTDDCTVSATFLPELALSFDIKQVHFNWPAVPGASHYRLMGKAGGEGAFKQVGEDIEGSAVSIDMALHRHDWNVMHYRLESCRGDECRPAYAGNLFGGGVDAVGYLKAASPDSEDMFGSVVALSSDGSTLAVGVPGESGAANGVDGDPADNSQKGLGAVYVYTREDGKWRQQAYLKPTEITRAFQGINGGFGSGVALSGSGDTLVAGFHSWGGFYLFEREDGAWRVEAAINGDLRQPVALSEDGKTLAVSARSGRYHSANERPPGCKKEIYTCVLPAESDFVSHEGCPDGFLCNLSQKETAEKPLYYTSDRFGAVYLFADGAEGWHMQGYVIAPHADSRDEFGTAIALSADGSMLAVGAPGEDSRARGGSRNSGDDEAQDAGAVYLYKRQQKWQQSAYIKASNTDKKDRFGSALALNAKGTWLAVGAPAEASRASGIDGDQADNSAAGTGAVYLFAVDGSDWRQQAYVKASNAGVTERMSGSITLGRQDRFGTAVALNSEGSLLIVGASQADGRAAGINGAQNDFESPASGAVYSFLRDGSQWRQQAFIKAPNSRKGQMFGGALALSGDGETLAVGSPYESSPDAVICASGSEACNEAQAKDVENGETRQVGAVYLY